MFCAAIPATAAAGVSLNAKQLEARRNAETDGREKPAMKPVMQVTGAVIVLLMLGSVTYHSFGYLP